MRLFYKLYMYNQKLNNQNMEKIIWSDGHTTTISSEEVLEKQYEIYTESGIEWRIKIGDAEFAWYANCWMQL